MRIVLDTHAWLWWVTEDRRLSKSAAMAIRRASKTGDVMVSAMSVWEIAKKAEKQQLVFDRPVRMWISQASRMPGLHLAELTPDILIESCELPAPFHGDPADQIIVATARWHQATVVTKDERIRDYAHVASLW